MNTLLVSAPGKVIVFGEHAVVHGKPAIAAAVSLRSYLLVEEDTHDASMVSLSLPDIELNASWDLKELPWTTFEGLREAAANNEPVTSLDKSLAEAVHNVLAHKFENVPEKLRAVHIPACTAFLFLYLSLRSPESRSTKFTLRSTLPIGAGLGSSASISVCLATALLLLRGLITAPYNAPKQNNNDLDTINKWAFVGELCIHGTPSGLDNTIATRGKAVLFQRRGPEEGNLVQPLQDFPELPLLLVDTKQSRSTSVEVAKVGALLKNQPTITPLILDAIGNVTLSAHALISSKDPDATEDSVHAQIGELARINHGLLVALGVSHPRLERIRELVDHEDIGWTKLTGAGGGGCAFTILRRQQTTDGKLAVLESSLESEGYKKFETTLGGMGVGVADLQSVGQGFNKLRDIFIENSDVKEATAGLSSDAEDFAKSWHYWNS